MEIRITMTNKAFIQRQMAQSGLTETEVEQLIEQSDFTDDANSFTKDKKRTKQELVESLILAWDVYSSATDPAEKKKAHKLYLEIAKYVTGDFTDDGRRVDADLLSALEASAERIKTASTPEERIRAATLHDELFTELQRRLASSDFTDDRAFPLANQLIAAMDRVYQIVVRTPNALIRELEKMTDAESDKVYRHKLITEFRIDLIP